MSGDDWEKLYQEHLQRRPRDQHAMGRLAARSQKLQPEEVEWFRAALKDPVRKWFAAALFGRARQVPVPLFHDLLRAAVLEPDPSNNKRFLFPCVATKGPAAVTELLADFLEKGTQEEKEGAVKAFYWASQGWRYIDPADPKAEERRTKTARARRRMLEQMLRSFLSNEDIRLRRAIIAQVSSVKDETSPELKSLTDEVWRVARQVDDDYVANRVGLQDGTQRLFKPLPP